MDIDEYRAMIDRMAERFYEYMAEVEEAPESEPNPWQKAIQEAMNRRY